MNNGYGEEFDQPYRLLVKADGDQDITNTDGYFAKMVMATGAETAQSLFQIAKEKALS